MQVAEIRDSLPTRFSDALTALLSPSPTTDLAIALSGGADSMALALLAHAWASARGGSITALTVDHRLRPESTEEAAWVSSVMRAHGIRHHTLTPTHTNVSNNMQEAARIWRYNALSEYCRAHGILHCLVAHHADDNRETVAHHVARGDTADGNSGMARIRNYNGVRFLRPMLAIERSEIEAYLRQQTARWVDDPSNQNPRFARVRIRQKLANDANARRELDAMIREGAAARAARDEVLAQAAIQCVTLHPQGFAELDVARWRMLDTNLASQLLADCITTIGGSTTRPRNADTMRLVQALSQPIKKRTLQRCEITQRGTIVTIAREMQHVEAPVLLEGCGERLWDQRFRVRYALEAGEQLTLRALGADGRKQWRQMHQTALPLSTPSLWHLDELVGVPHIEATHSAASRVQVGFAPPKPLAAAPFW